MTYEEKAEEYQIGFGEQAHLNEEQLNKPILQVQSQEKSVLNILKKVC